MVPRRPASTAPTTSSEPGSTVLRTDRRLAVPDREAHRVESPVDGREPLAPLRVRDDDERRHHTTTHRGERDGVVAQHRQLDRAEHERRRPGRGHPDAEAGERTGPDAVGDRVDLGRSAWSSTASSSGPMCSAWARTSSSSSDATTAPSSPTTATDVAPEVSMASSTGDEPTRTARAMSSGRRSRGAAVPCRHGAGAGGRGGAAPPPLPARGVRRRPRHLPPRGGGRRAGRAAAVARRWTPGPPPPFVIGAAGAAAAASLGAVRERGLSPRRPRPRPRPSP